MIIKVVTELDVPDEFLSDVLAIAFDGNYGGCWYWAEPKHTPDGSDPWTISDEGNWVSVRVVEKDASRVNNRRAWAVVDHARLAKGIQKLFEPGILPKRQDIRDAVLQKDAGLIDADSADVIVQLAFFGSLVYG